MNKLQSVAAMCLIGLAPLSLPAQSPVITIPKESKFVLQVNVPSIQKTKLGSALLEFAKAKAMEEMGDTGKDGSKGLEKIKEVIGFDPFEDIQAITFSTTDYEKPERSMLAIVRLKKNSGNLEGLALGLPQYKSSEYGKHLIHSSAPDENMRVYGAIHGEAEGDKTLVLCPSLECVQSVLDRLDGKGATNDAFRTVEIASSNAPMLRLEVYDVPMDKLGDGPQVNVAKILKSFMLDVRDDSGDKIKVAAKMSAGSEKQAEQLRQMAQGMIAAIDFAQGLDDNDDLKKVRELLTSIDATRDGANVEVGVSINSSKLYDAIKEELD